LVRRIITTISFVLLIVTLVMWARSQWVSDTFADLRVAGNTDDPVLRLSLVRSNQSSVIFFHSNASFEPMSAVDAQALAGDLPVHISYMILHGRTGKYILHPDDRTSWGFGWHRREQQIGTLPSFWYTGKKESVEITRFDETTLVVPWWSFALLFSIAPALAKRHWRRTRRPTSGYCPQCHYDLRSSPSPTGPQFPVCPECGFAPADSKINRSPTQP
jgi:hypothetical protein